MTTATKQKTTTSSELRKLVQVRDEFHAKAREAKAEATAWDTETEQMRWAFQTYLDTHPDEAEGAERRLKPGTEAAKLSAEIRERRNGENPHQAAYEAARDEFHVHDRAVQEFKLERVFDRISELHPEIAAADEKIRAGFELLLEGCEGRRATDEKVRAVILDTPGRTGQDFAHDPRPNEWYALAQQALGEEIVKPGLTLYAAAKVADHG